MFDFILLMGFRYPEVLSSHNQVFGHHTYLTWTTVETSTIIICKFNTY